MDQEPDVIRQHIDETRSSLTEKLETLEGQVRDTVQEAKATVEGTIESVKTTVQDTVQSVKRTFDLPYQVNRHPWFMVGGSVLAGFAIGSLTTGRRSRRGTFAGLGGFTGDGRSASPTGIPEYRTAAASPYAPPPEPSGAPSKPSWLSKVLEQFDDEIDKVKGIAIGALAGVARDLVKQSLPPNLASQLEDVMNSATTKLGGTPVRGPILQPCEPGSAPPQELGRSAFTS